MKKKGSSVVTILAVVMILMLVGGIVLKMTMDTTRLNEGKKQTDDLKYGAEGGLEIARSYLNKNGYEEVNDAIVEQAINNQAVILTKSQNTDSNVTNLNIELNPINDSGVLKGVEVISNAKLDEGGKIKDEKMKMKLNLVKGHNGNFMDHGLVGGEGGVHMEDTGSVNLESTSVSAGLGGIQYPDKTSSVKPPTQENEHTNSFGQLEFINPEERKDKIYSNLAENQEFTFSTKDTSGGSTSIEAIKVKIKMEVKNGKMEAVIDGSTENPQEYLKRLKAPIIELEILNGAQGEITQQNPRIIIINSKEFELEIGVGGRLLHNTIIINSGETIINGEGALNMVNSTIIANELQTGMKISVTITGQPNKVDNNSYGVFDKDEEEALNKLLDAIIPNWGENNTGGSDKNFIVDEGSFSD